MLGAINTITRVANTTINPLLTAPSRLQNRASANLLQPAKSYDGFQSSTGQPGEPLPKWPLQLAVIGGIVGGFLGGVLYFGRLG